MKATVKWFNRVKGYGFIIDEESKKDVFVHHSNIIMNGYRTVNEDDIVKYEREKVSGSVKNNCA